MNTCPYFGGESLCDTCSSRSNFPACLPSISKNLFVRRILKLIRATRRVATTDVFMVMPWCDVMIISRREDEKQF